jgi:hypothetical protein
MLAGKKVIHTIPTHTPPNSPYFQKLVDNLVENQLYASREKMRMCDIGSPFASDKDQGAPLSLSQAA